MVTCLSQAGEENMKNKKPQARKVRSSIPHTEIMPAFQLYGLPVTSDQCSFGAGVKVSSSSSLVLIAFSASVPWVRLCP